MFVSVRQFQLQMQVIELENLINNADTSAFGSVLQGIRNLQIEDDAVTEITQDNLTQNKLHKVITLLNIAEAGLTLLPTSNTSKGSIHNKEMWFNICRDVNELEKIRVAKENLNKRVKYEKAIQEYDQLKDVNKRTEKLHALMCMLSEFNHDVEVRDLLLKHCTHRLLTLKTNLEKEMSFALGEQGVEWSKQYGASFRTDSVRVKKLTDSMTSLNQFQSMTMTDVGKSVLFGSLFEQQHSSFPIDYYSTTGTNLSTNLSKTSWCEYQLVKPIAQRMWWHFDNGGVMDRMDQPHKVYTFARDVIIESVEFLEQYVHAIAVPFQKNLLKQVCEHFVHHCIHVVNDIMKGRMEDGLVDRPREWLLTIQAAIHSDNLLEKSLYSNSRDWYRSVMFHDPFLLEKTLLVANMDGKAAKSLLNRVLLNTTESERWSSTASRRKQKIDMSAAATASKNTNILETLSNRWSLQKKRRSGIEETGGIVATDMLGTTPVSERFYVVMLELRARAERFCTSRSGSSNQRNKDQNSSTNSNNNNKSRRKRNKNESYRLLNDIYLEQTMMETIRAYGRTCGDAWDKMAVVLSTRELKWPGEFNNSKIALSSSSSSSSSSSVLKTDDIWVIRCGIMNSLRFGHTLLRTWGEEDTVSNETEDADGDGRIESNIPFASLCRWNHERSFQKANNERKNQRDAARLERQRQYETARRRRRRSLERMSSVDDVIEWIGGTNPTLVKSAVGTLRAASDGVSTVVDELHHEMQNNDTVQMIGPMRTIHNIASSEAVSTFANVGLNVLGNVMNLSRTIVDAAEEFSEEFSEEPVVEKSKTRGDAESMNQNDRRMNGTGNGPPQRLSLVEEGEEEDDENDDEEDAHSGKDARDVNIRSSNGDIPSSGATTTTDHPFSSSGNASNVAATKAVAAQLEAQAEELANEEAEEEQEMLRQEQEHQTRESQEDVDARTKCNEAIACDLRNGGTFQKYVLKLENLSNDYMNVMLDELRDMASASLKPYLELKEGGWWWSRHDSRKHAIEFKTPTLSFALVSFAECRRILAMQLNDTLFRVIWKRLAEHIDLAIYNQVIRSGHRFRDVGVEQLRQDYERLCDIFLLKEKENENDLDDLNGDSVKESPFCLLYETLVIFGWSNADRTNLIEALDQLSDADDRMNYNVMYANNNNEQSSGELIQMYAMLKTKGIKNMHPEHVLSVSSVRLQ